ncbi:hypothetical protein ZOD2009_14156 [Haladaptatus paucihalophilus DX253]|uniref:Uncharacterized protein n=1 Tax=Haladaptatus paucihalophilus DX253 TaxID=797209 RepID=E7QVJ5_HALPU|nr:hypothetical protein ZOD2009_14156 [Haladaptatus paucihalophilus DX253]SHL08980.1 hypothetical protein SAMN05444342_2986 [Haladaptatus paucihalophilus DX253]
MTTTDIKHTDGATHANREQRIDRPRHTDRFRETGGRR